MKGDYEGVLTPPPPHPTPDNSVVKTIKFRSFNWNCAGGKKPAIDNTQKTHWKTVTSNVEWVTGFVIWVSSTTNFQKLVLNLYGKEIIRSFNMYMT